MYSKNTFKFIFYLVYLLSISLSAQLDQIYHNYLLPGDTAITTTDSLYIYGRLGIPNKTEGEGNASGYSAILNLVFSGDPRFYFDFKFDAVFDKDVDGRDQYKAVVKDLPEGKYNFCYVYYYLNERLSYFGGKENEDGFFYPGHLTIENPTDIDPNDFNDRFNFNLENNYPNPFNPTTEIRYSLPEQSLVTLKIFDVIGKEIKTLVNKVQQSGNYAVEFSGSSLSSGIYFYRLNAGASTGTATENYVETKKMILLK